MSQKVTVIGAGRMGSALATALFSKGFATSVWNRTAAKTEPLARLGMHVAPDLLEAVVSADVVIVNILDYNSTNDLLWLPEIESALRGKVLVQLTTGTPDEAREAESWAQAHGIDYLDGAIMSWPVDIGQPKATIVYAGSEELFTRVKPVLLAFGDNVVYLGPQIGHADAFDMAALSFAMGGMLGFLQGYVVYEAEGLSPEGFMPFIKGLMPVLDMILSSLHGTLQSKDYANTQAALDVWAPCPRELMKWCSAHGVDHSFVEPQLRLMEKAIKAGKGQFDFSYLYEVLKNRAM
ncbi:MAG TPA: NAD(P)-binding domain-containing protein [Candidatus Koribacter sp.]|jgi:3-hydroxyisobutyrate dehydrogenase-like beta-hydroxyacid dehydrogenase